MNGDRKDFFLKANEMGYLPRQGETAELFYKRIKNQQFLPAPHWDWVSERLRKLFDCAPTWINVTYSNKQLAPWQAAATWVEGGQVVLVQLREAFRKGSLWGFYAREEILAHEAVHAIRAGLNSTKWEEFFAYMTSEKKWRQVLGPIVRRPWELWPFLVLICLGAMWEPFFSLALVWAAIGIFRLIYMHRQLNKASSQVFKAVQNLKNTRAILVRLTDDEIDALSQGVDLNCLSTKKKELRWDIIRAAYF